MELNMRRLLKILYLLTTTLLIVLVALIVITNFGPLSARVDDGANHLISAIKSEVAANFPAPSGEKPETVSSTPSPSAASAPSQDGWGKTGMDGITVYEYGRSLLADNEQRSCYDQIAAAVLAVNGSVKINASLDPLTLEDIYKYYFCDHTENFYLSNVSMAYSYTQIGSVKKYESYTFTFTYSYDKGTVANMRAQMGALALKMLSAANGITGDEAKERALHDALVGAVHYDNDAAVNAQSHPESFTAYGALVNNTAVCDGYAKSMKLLLDSAGVKSIYVSGTATNDSGTASHAWDMAQVAGKWYYLDPTFDDPVFYNSNNQYVNKNEIEHTYFNYKSNSDHTLGTFNSSDPFSDTSENYAVMPSVG
jgi:hypothetical protein